MKIRKCLRFLGGFLLLLACALAFFWFVWLTPFKHIYSWTWYRDHSTYAYWAEEEKSIYHLGFDHDTSIQVGDFGDKKWAERVIRELNSSKQEQAMGSCGEWPYHLVDAIAKMTNQRMTNNADWLVWWEKNKDKTQLDWIREGFAQKGIVLQQPLTTNNIVDLLKVVRHTTNFTFFTNVISGDLYSALRYNAFRWLRDSGFRSTEFDLKNIPEEDRIQITSALIGYAEWFGAHRDDPGKLQITGIDIGDGQWRDAVFETRSFRWTLYSIIVVLALGGCFLLRLSHSNRSL